VVRGIDSAKHEQNKLVFYDDLYDCSDGEDHLRISSARSSAVESLSAVPRVIASAG
jgi:hypothetical protein